MSRVTTLIWAHRGASTHAPENTLAAFERAIQDGADGIELDVRDAACDTIVVAHDPTIDRLAGRPGVVASMRAEELAQLEVATLAGRTRGMPKLDDAIDLTLGANLQLNIELKGDVPHRVRTARLLSTLLKRRSLREREALMVSSFRPEMLAVLRALQTRVRVAFLFDAKNTGSVRAEALRMALQPDGVHPIHTLATRESIARWKRQGHFVNVWTVDDEARLQGLARDGVDGVIVNDPARARTALRRAM
jgi:glycerophosphoryl diester phosphodiesterase